MVAQFNKIYGKLLNLKCKVGEYMLCKLNLKNLIFDEFANCVNCLI